MTSPDIDSLSTYGGALVNYAPVVDPTTDRDAAAANQAYASTAAMTHTSPRAFARIVGAASTGALALAGSNPHDSQWGKASPVTPTLSRTALGIVVVTWPATVTDELGVVHNLNFRYAKAWIEGATPFWTPQCTVTANTVTINLFSTGFAASDLVGITYGVMVY